MHKDDIKLLIAALLVLALIGGFFVWTVSHCEPGSLDDFPIVYPL